MPHLNLPHSSYYSSKDCARALRGIALLLFVVFFFQAEDGIRDHCVTGVQTCALPIYIRVTSLARMSTASSLRGRRGSFGACSSKRSFVRGSSSVGAFSSFRTNGKARI